MTGKTAFRQGFALKGGDFVSAGRASCAVKELLKEIGLDPQTVRRIAIASYEAEMNVIMYARRGRLSLAVTPGRVLIIVDDRGPGIPDVPLAMTEGYSTATPEMQELGFGAGMGLPNIKKNTDRLRITSKVGHGTRLEMAFLANGSKP